MPRWLVRFIYNRSCISVFFFLKYSFESLVYDDDDHGDDDDDDDYHEEEHDDYDDGDHDDDEVGDGLQILLLP